MLIDVFISYIQRLDFQPGFSPVLAHLRMSAHFHSYKSGGLSACLKNTFALQCGHGKRKFCPVKRSVKITTLDICS